MRTAGPTTSRTQPVSALAAEVVNKALSEGAHPDVNPTIEELDRLVARSRPGTGDSQDTHRASRATRPTQPARRASEGEMGEEKEGEGATSRNRRRSTRLQAAGKAVSAREQRAGSLEGDDTKPPSAAPPPPKPSAPAPTQTQETPQGMAVPPSFGGASPGYGMAGPGQFQPGMMQNMPGMGMHAGIHPGMYPFSNPYQSFGSPYFPPYGPPMAPPHMYGQQYPHMQPPGSELHTQIAELKVGCGFERSHPAMAHLRRVFAEAIGGAAERRSLCSP